MKINFSLLFFLIILTSCKNSKEPTITFEPKKETQLILVNKTTDFITIDGHADEVIWQTEPWFNIDQLWLGQPYDSTDFNGRYKLTWKDDALYALVEIHDDTLYDQYSDPLKLWWDDDCVEVFIDEDNSGGEHQYNHNAFAYHVALDGNVVDIAPDEIPTLYNDHVISKRTTVGNISLWEMKIKLFDDTFIDGQQNKPKTLKANKKIGFAMAYCDNDSSKERENFIGSIFVPGKDKNQGWINANIFGTLQLVD